MATAGSSQASTAAHGNSNRTDPGWKYCHPLKEGDTNSIVCNFCEKITKGGITRAKYHLMGKKGNVAPCPKCPKEVREELWSYLREKDKSTQAKEMESGGANIDLESLGYGYDEEEEGLREIMRVKKKAKTVDRSCNKKGPIDLYMFQPPESIIAKRKKDKARQSTIRDACDKEARNRVNQYIARWFYQAGISFNAVKLKSFDHMIEAIGAYGSGLRGPTYHEMRVPLLKKEVSHTEQLMSGHKLQWEKHGCSIMSDGWTDRKQRGLINFLVNSPAGTMFVKSVDASKYTKTGEKIFEYLDALIDEIGEEKVVQVISDNGSNYVLAGKLLEDKRKHLYWTPCAAHCIDLMLEDIGKIPEVKKTIQRAITLVGFIYNHSIALNLMRSFTNKRELVRHAITRFATSFLTLERLYQEKENIKRMFFSEQWAKCNLAKDSKGKEVAKIALMPSFWPKVVYALKVMGPLVKVLRLVDSEKKPAMGYIYEAMDKAKEAIMRSFKGDEKKYKEVFEIIDKRWNCQLHRPLHAAGHFLNPEYFYDNPSIEFDLEITSGLYQCLTRLVPNEDVQQKILNELPIYKTASGLFANNFAISQRKIMAPAEWWRMFGQSAPNLQQLAIKILSLTCSASGCERNWSVFEHVHSKKRNKLEHQRLNDLVFVKYNQALKERYDCRNEIDPISLSNIDDCNEWLVGEMEDEDNAENELIHEDDDTLNWGTVYKATGLGEMRTYTRSKARNEGGSSSARAEKKQGPSSSAKARPLGEEELVILEEEEDTEDGSEDEVGYASNDDEQYNDEEDNYMEDEDE